MGIAKLQCAPGQAPTVPRPYLGCQERNPAINTLKSQLGNSLKIAIPILILTWLLRKEWMAIEQLWWRPKDAVYLTISFSCLLAASLVTFVRWFLLVRALDIPFTIRQAVRLGFLGTLFNFVGPSSIGGDLFKAYFLARDQSERRMEAVATIFLDRVIGLYGLFVVTSVVSWWANVSATTELRVLLQVVLFGSVAGAIGIPLVLCSGEMPGKLLRMTSRLPLVSGIAQRIISGLALYQRRRLWFIPIVILGMSSHLLTGLTIHFADRAVHPTTPSLSEHLTISPLAGAAGAAPVPGGLGTYEFAMDYLFRELPKQQTESGQGLAVAVIYRLETIGLAAIGVCYFFLHRRDVGRTVKEMADDAAQNLPQAPTTR